MEQEIIQPIAKEVLKSELTPDRQLRMTNKSHNEIYIITAHNAPNVMKEIGRLREIAFREAGGGTGKSMDIDEFDTCDNCYKQLIVWNPEAEEIIGGYRYLLGTDWEYDERVSPFWLPVICSTSPIALLRSMPLGPSNSVVHSSLFLIRVRAWVPRACLHSITCVMDLVR